MSAIGINSQCGAGMKRNREAHKPGFPIPAHPSIQNLRMLLQKLCALGADDDVA